MDGDIYMHVVTEQMESYSIIMKLLSLETQKHIQSL